VWDRRTSALVDQTAMPSVVGCLNHQTCGSCSTRAANQCPRRLWPCRSAFVGVPLEFGNVSGVSVMAHRWRCDLPE
jgi:hypothetical protein